MSAFFFLCVRLCFRKRNTQLRWFLHSSPPFPPLLQPSSLFYSPSVCLSGLRITLHGFPLRFKCSKQKRKKKHKYLPSFLFFFSLFLSFLHFLFFFQAIYSQTSLVVIVIYIYIYFFFCVCVVAALLAVRKVSSVFSPFFFLWALRVLKEY